MRCGASCRCTPFVSVIRASFGDPAPGCPRKATDDRHSDKEGFHVGGTTMIRATVLRALVLTAAFAAALTPVTGLGENSNQLPARAAKELPAKATKELPPELLSLLRQRKMP